MNLSAYLYMWYTLKNIGKSDAQSSHKGKFWFEIQGLLSFKLAC